MLTDRNRQIFAILQNFLGFFAEYQETLNRAGPDICDFAIGNPHEMPLPPFVQAIQAHAEPQNKDWFAYKVDEPTPKQHVANTLRQRLGIAFEPDDVLMTNGATGALHIALGALLDPGDEVIINLPPWFFYEAFVVACQGAPVKVNVRPDNFDLDIDAIRAAITPRTRAIIVNSPNNPTGRIYPPETLTALAQVLGEASQRNGRPIYLISDEAYSRILFDGTRFISPTGFYPYSLLVYTYGKTLLTPGQRLGFLAVPPAMPDKAELHQALFITQVVYGLSVPNAVMQYALPDLEKLSIDLEHLQYKRDWMMNELRGMGYEMMTPEGTFYLLVRSPLEDDLAFTRLLAANNVVCLPGSAADVRGYFRISLTANDAMIERGLPGFAAAMREAALRSAV